MAVTIGNFGEFKKLLPEELSNAYPARQKAISTYLSAGGITKFEKADGFPCLVYPTPKRLEEQIAEAEGKLKSLDRQMAAWHRRHSHLKTDKLTDTAKLAADPLYWEHRAKLLADPSYRTTYELVRPPMHLLHREKWRKRLKMFIRSKEYRLRLHEARISKIGKRRLPMAEEVEARFDFNRKMASSELAKLKEKRKVLNERLSAMKALLLWVR